MRVNSEIRAVIVKNYYLGNRKKLEAFNAKGVSTRLKGVQRRAVWCPHDKTPH